MRWNTNEVFELLRSSDWDIEVGSKGGDYDTDNIYITPHGCEDENLTVLGFDTSKVCGTPSDADVSMVKVSDGLDSAGGLNSADSKMAHAYADVCARLRQHGFTVVPNMRDYF